MKRLAHLSANTAPPPPPPHYVIIVNQMSISSDQDQRQNKCKNSDCILDNVNPRIKGVK